MALLCLLIRQIQQTRKFIIKYHLENYNEFLNAFVKLKKNIFSRRNSKVKRYGSYSF